MFDFSFFDKIYDRTNTSAIKYTDLPEAEKMPVIPMWIADMDFLSAPAITEALRRTADHGIYGYGEIDEEYKNLVIDWYNRRMGWKIESDELLTMPGVMFGVTMAIRALTKENDAVLICQPVYYPFEKVVVNNNRKLVVNELVLNNGRYEIDFDDFEESFDDYYRFLNGVLYCDSGNIPTAYQDAWSTFKMTVWLNKTDLDNLYGLKGDELVVAASNMITSVQAGIALIGESFPNAIASEVKIADTISLEFVEMTLESLNISDKILPEDTDSGYLYISDVENEQYFCIAGTLKNLSGASYDVENIYVEMVFDEKYTYAGQLSACAWTNDFYGSNVKPLGKVKYYLHTSIPDELIDSWATCSVTFGFKENFDGGYYVEKAECDYLYTINLEHQQ